MSKAKKSTGPRREPSLEPFILHLRPLTAPVNIVDLASQVTDVDDPEMAQINSTILIMNGDDRFILEGEGIATMVSLIESEREIPVTAAPSTTEPEEITLGEAQVGTLDGLPGEGIQVSGADPDGKAVPPAVVAPVDATPTIGEHIAAAETIAAKQETIAEAGETIHHQAETSAHDAELEGRFTALREIAEELETFEAEHARLKKSASEAKKAVDAKRAEMIVMINGDTAEEVSDRPVFRMAKETPPAATASPTLAAVAASATPAPIQGNFAPMDKTQAFNLYGMGRDAAKAGTREKECPLSAQKDPNGRARWFAGYRDFLMVEKEPLAAIKQGFVHDTIAVAAMRDNGLLQPGVEQPKVATIEWMKRPHLVLDMTCSDVQENWYLQPLFDKEEWKILHQDAYGVAVMGTHTDPEREADRLKGGEDCGKGVKVGRKVYVVGPRQLVATVFCPKGA